MKNQISLLILVLLLPLKRPALNAQDKPKLTTQKVGLPSKALLRPKLVVGIVVDQMRYDFLYRYWEKYGENGFKRLVNQGFSCEFTHYNYYPTITGPGHASVYTGASPSIHGIVGNHWFNKSKSQKVYCTEDSEVQGVGGGAGKIGQMSPKNLLSTTITDQLRLATNFKGKTIGIALKDRSSILPGGHSSNGSYWFDYETGNFITSTYYMKSLPAWVANFNENKLAEKFKSETWKTILPIEAYTESTTDDQPYEGQPWAGKKPVFPYYFKEYPKPDFEMVRCSPFGNTLTTAFATAAIDSEQLGADSETDFLALSYSSTDIVGHKFGPNSIEIEDTYLRLDQDLANLINHVNQKVGIENTLFFLTADHAVLEVPAFLNQHKIPSILFDGEKIEKELSAALEVKFQAKELIQKVMNLQIYLNETVISAQKLSVEEVFIFIRSFLLQKNGISDVFLFQNDAKQSLPYHLAEKYNAGFKNLRSGDIQIVLNPNVLDSEDATGTSHGAPYEYDSHVPLVFMGWKVRQGNTVAPVKIIDIAPTLSTLLHIMAPSGCYGKPVSIPLKP